MSSLPVRRSLAVGCLLLFTAVARAGTIAVPAGPDVGGKGSGRQLQQVAATAVANAGMAVASAAAIAKAAKAAHVSLSHGLKAGRGAGALALHGRFSAVVTFRKGRGGAVAQLVDPQGHIVVERLLHVSRDGVSTGDAETFANAVAQALGEATPPPPAAPPPAASPAPIEEGATTAPSEETAPPPGETGPEAGPAAESEPLVKKEGPGPSAGYFFRVEVIAGVQDRLFLTPTFSYTTQLPYLYPTGGIAIEAYPFRSFGLGIQADFLMALVSDQEGTQTFTSTDLRFDGAIAYRWRLFDSPMGTILVPRIGVGIRRFDAPATSGVAGDDRFYLIGGLDIIQPIVARYLRIAAGIAALPLSQSQGSSGSFGLEWRAGLEGDIIGGLEWALQADQERFMDSYSGSGSGIEVLTLYDLRLRYRF